MWQYLTSQTLTQWSRVFTNNLKLPTSFGSHQSPACDYVIGSFTLVWFQTGSLPFAGLLVWTSSVLLVHRMMSFGYLVKIYEIVQASFPKRWCNESGLAHKQKQTGLWSLWEDLQSSFTPVIYSTLVIHYAPRLNLSVKITRVLWSHSSREALSQKRNIELWIKGETRSHEFQSDPTAFSN